jgi:hypothetical protein
VKVAVILEGLGGELDRAEREIDENGESDFESAVDDFVMDQINGWPLSVGDTIRIVEVQS